MCPEDTISCLCKVIVNYVGVVIGVVLHMGKSHSLDVGVNLSKLDFRFLL